MAAVIGALRAELSASIAKFEADMGKAAKAVDKFSTNFKKLGRQMERTGKTLSTRITAPVLALGAVSTKVFSDFQKGMSDVSTLVDTAAENMASMGREVLKIGRRTPVALRDLTAALFDVRSAGITAGDAMGVLENSARLGVAGLGSTKEAADLVTSSINAFGLTGEKAAGVYDLIFKTTKNGKTTITGLAKGFGAVASVVANAGVELDEYLASVAALTTTGLPAAQAHTQLRAVIVGLTRDTDLAREVFKKLGVETFAGLIKKSGGMVPALQRIVTALDGNDAAIIKLVGSTEAYNAIIGLTGGQNAAFTKTMDSMRSGVDEIGGAFDKQNKTFAAIMQRLRNVLESAAISIGTILAPVLETLAGWLIKIADGFEALSPETQKVIVVAAALVAAIGPVLLILGALAAAIGAVAPVLATVGIAIAAIGAGPLILILAPIAAVVAAWVFWDEIVAIVQRVYEGVKMWIMDKLGAVFDWLQGRLEAVTGFFRDMFQAVVGGSIVPDMIDGIAAQFARLDGAMVTPAKEATGEIAQAFQTVADGIESVFERALDDGKVSFDELKSLALDTARQLADTLFINPFVNQAKGGLSSLFGGGGGGGGAGIGSILGSLFAGFFARGGMIPRGSFGIVGENGPEPVFASGSDLTVLPNSSLGGNVTQIFNINAPDPNAFRLSSRQMARMAKQRFAIA